MTIIYVYRARPIHFLRGRPITSQNQSTIDPTSLLRAFGGCLRQDRLVLTELGLVLAEATDARPEPE